MEKTPHAPERKLARSTDNFNQYLQKMKVFRYQKPKNISSLLGLPNNETKMFGVDHS
jgi:hypothetical protein